MRADNRAAFGAASHADAAEHRTAASAPASPDGSPDGSGDDTAVADLLHRAASDDQDAWAELVGLYGRRVYALVRSRLRHDHVAEEITQGVFVTVAVKLRSGGYEERGRFESWLFRVAMNRVRDEARRRKRRGVTAGDAALHGVAATHDEGESNEAASLQALRSAMAELNDADRAVIELRHHGQMNFKDMAAVTGEPVGTLLAQHHRALRKLRACLERRGLDAAALFGVGDDDRGNDA